MVHFTSAFYRTAWAFSVMTMWAGFGSPEFPAPSAVDFQSLMSSMSMSTSRPTYLSCWSTRQEATRWWPEPSAPLP